MAPSFLDILRVHTGLHARFLAHQVAVLERDFDTAHKLLVEYRRKLLDHMRDEEEALIPIYEREPPAPHGKVEFFVHEHRTMLESLDEIRDLLAAAAQTPEESSHAAILALLDRETSYKNFAEHHEMREERWLFPALDRLATAEEKERLIAQCMRT
ncbi:MAG: hypothetical protein CMJ85_01715 [Planctomycetes bacterium]|jgi:iron-sulfur cluster repair protein YtfE (RIC family)|nr:hypothetical protein [Planctomycetota bacterium]